MAGLFIGVSVGRLVREFAELPDGEPGQAGATGLPGGEPGETGSVLDPGGIHCPGVYANHGIIEIDVSVDLFKALIELIDGQMLCLLVVIFEFRPVDQSHDHFLQIGFIGLMGVSFLLFTLQFDAELSGLLIARHSGLFFQAVDLTDAADDLSVDGLIDHKVVLGTVQNKGSVLAVFAYRDIGEVGFAEQYAHIVMGKIGKQHQKQLIIGDLCEVHAYIVKLYHVLKGSGSQRRDQTVILLFILQYFPNGGDPDGQIG